MVRRSDEHDGRPLYAEVVRRARKAGLAGATVTVAIDGFMHPGDERRRTWLRVGRNAPAVITIVDVEPRIRSFLTDLDDVLDDALALLEEVRVPPLPDTR
ncbi:DUF190 domain-containing protein [Actinoallomurus vinaceus]|uniref:DUF190 domain-containing protein n=1 Tax=Actinoallomurus vinaceus TaxID=1080074 RepID=UPI0031EAB8A3